MKLLNDVVNAVNGILWDKNLLLFLLVGTGVFFSVRTGFIQIRRFRVAWRRVFSTFRLTGVKAGKEGMSSFQALTTAIAAQVGTGNIAGCATALYSGGPGAIFWMWVSAFFGMSTIYAEAVLAQKTKTKNAAGQTVGGPVYYILRAFPGGPGRFMAGFFAVAIILALGFMGNMVQSNSISDAFYTAFRIPKLAVGIFCAVVAAFIFLGGISRIASFTEKVVPVMAVLYLIGGVVVLIINIGNLPGAVVSIFTCAFQPQAVLGAGIGITVRQAMRYGVARGLFSNEAGMGSTPHAHAMAQVEKPSDQGEVAMIGVFVDTFIVLTMTALVILSSGMLQPVNGERNGVPLTGTFLAQTAFATGLGGFGNAFIAICLLFFAFSTIISWYFFGETNVRYLFGEAATKVYAVIVIFFILAGSLLKVDLVWNMSDMFNGLMVIPNLIAVLALNGIVREAANEKRNG